MWNITHAASDFISSEDCGRYTRSVQ